MRAQIHQNIMGTVKLLIIFTLLSTLFGQIIRISPFANAAITPTDIFLVLTVICFFFVNTPKIRSLKIISPLFVSHTLFSMFASATLILSLTIFSAKDVISGSLFLLRFVLYFYFTFVVALSVSKTEVKSYLSILLQIGIIYAVLGFLQIILFPDLTFLSAYGWDPHQRRVVSTFLDPNFSGYIFVFFLALTLSMYLNFKKPYLVMYSLVFTAALVLTFSRSSYLAFLATVTVIGIFKSPRLLLLASTTAVLLFLTVPRVNSRVIGAFSLDDTSQARIESWQNAAKIFKDYPLFGVGFNNYRTAQATYGFFSTDLPEGGHSGSGVDSSLLLVLVTTGVVGLVFYLFFLAQIGRIFFKDLKSNYITLAGTASFAALLIHSLFVNSLFFPQILIFFWTLLGLALVKSGKTTS